MPTKDAWPPTEPGERQRLMAQLAHGYFVEGMSKVSLGKKANLSRFQVAALLQEAKDNGIVQIEIAAPVGPSDEELARSVGLQRLVTVGSTRWPADRNDLAQVAAREVGGILRDDDVLGISWSRTLQLVVHHLPPLPRNDVIQLAGALNGGPGTASQPPRLLASLDSRSAWPLWAPLVVEHAAALKRSPEIDTTLRLADSLDVAVLAVGRWGQGSSTVWPRVSEDLARAAQAAGAVAEVSGHLLNSEGQELHTPVEDLIVAASIEQIRAAGHKVAVASGAVRAPAVLAAVKSGLVDHLVCDTSLRDELERILTDSPHPAHPGCTQTPL